MGTKTSTGTSKFMTQFTNYAGSPGIDVGNDSITKPDMHIGLKQLLINHSRGISSNVKVHPAEYFGDEPLPEIEDLVDAREYVEMLREREKAINEEIKEAIQNAKKAKDDAKRKSEAALESRKETRPGGKSDPQEPPLE